MHPSFEIASDRARHRRAIRGGRGTIRAIRSKQRGRAGYTLLELLLVLSILLIVVGLTWSTIGAIFGHQRLLEGAEQVRLRLAAGRTRSIESGELLQFVYEADGRGYALVPIGQSTDADAAVAQLEGELPESMHFEVPAEVGASISAAVADAEPLPVVFAPDGTATDAAFDVVDDEGRFVRISVRGLTAAVSMTSPSRRDEP